MLCKGPQQPRCRDQNRHRKDAFTETQKSVPRRPWKRPRRAFVIDRFDHGKSSTTGYECVAGCDRTPHVVDGFARVLGQLVGAFYIVHEDVKMSYSKAGRTSAWQESTASMSRSSGILPCLDRWQVSARPGVFLEVRAQHRQPPSASPRHHVRLPKLGFGAGRSSAGEGGASAQAQLHSGATASEQPSLAAG